MLRIQSTACALWELLFLSDLLSFLLLVLLVNVISIDSKIGKANNIKKSTARKKRKYISTQEYYAITHPRKNGCLEKLSHLTKFSHAWRDICMQAYTQRDLSVHIQSGAHDFL